MCCRLQVAAESNDSLLPGLWRDSLHVTCGLTACTPGSAPGPTLGNEYGKTLPFYFFVDTHIWTVVAMITVMLLKSAFYDWCHWSGERDSAVI